MIGEAVDDRREQWFEQRAGYGALDRYRTAVAIALTMAVVYLVVAIWAAATNSYDTWGGFVVAPAVFFIGAPILRHLLRKVEPDQWIRNVVMLGFGAKLLGAYARFYTNEYLIGRGDAFVYDQHGRLVSDEFRQFIFGGPAYQQSIPDLVGTEFIRLLISLVYTVVGQTRIGGFVVFSFLSFWGLYLFYRAHAMAMPDGLRRRYAVLVFFLPSMVFWPSSVGKEAWMTTMLGLGTYGLARLLTRRRLAYPIIAAAVAGLGVVRPHVAAIFLVGLGAAMMLNRASGATGRAKKILGLLFFAVVAGLVLSQLQSFFGLEEGLDPQAVFDKTTERTTQGGSRFETTQPTSITGLPWAVVTVLFRPFLFEVGSAAGVFTAVEGTVLLGLFLWNATRLVRLPGTAIVRPYVGFAVAYALVFVFAFSAVSNFGILARQRTQLLPIVVIALTIPSGAKGTRDLLELRARQQASPDEAFAPGPASGSRRVAAPPPQPAARPGAGRRGRAGFRLDGADRAHRERRFERPGRRERRPPLVPPSERYLPHRATALAGAARAGDGSANGDGSGPPGPTTHRAPGGR